MLKNLPISTKFNLILLFGSASFLAFVLPIIGGQFHTLTKQIARQRLQEERAVIQSHFTEAERELRSEINVLVTAPGLAEAIKRQDVGQIRSILISTATPFERIDEFDLITREGERIPILARDGVADENESVLLALALAGEQHISISVNDNEANPVDEAADGRYPPIYLTASAPVLDSTAAIIGAMSIGRQIDADYLARTNFSRSTVHLLLFRHGKLVASDKVGYLPQVKEGATSEGLPGLSFIDQQAVARAERGELVLAGNFVTIDSSGQEYALAYAPFWVKSKIEGATVLLLDVGELAAFQDQFVRNVAVLVSIFAILTAWFIILFARSSVAAPIRNLSQAAEQFTAGNFKARAPLTSNDELGFLAQSFNKMADELEQNFGTMEERVATRTQALRKANEMLVLEVKERRAIESALQESEDQLRQVYASISDHIYVTEVLPDGRHVNRFMSPTEPLTGYPLEKMLNDWSFWPTQVIHPDDQASASGQAGRLAAGRNSEIEYRIVRSDGSIIWVRDNARVEQDPETHHLMVYGVVSDITEKKEAEVALAEARDEALSASQAKSELLAKVSHELRTPLGAILGYVELMKKGLFGSINDKQSEIADEIIDSANYLNNLVGELLDQARIERGQINIFDEPFNLRQIVHQIETTMAVTADARQLALSLMVEESLPQMLIGDPQRIQQIMINLLNNAIKFTRQGEVRLRCYACEAGKWVIQVSDTGPGIPKQAQSYIFEPFRQVDGSITRDHGGTGLGLSIVRQIVGAMGGEITVESELGQGATFTVSLPLKLIEERIA